MTSPDWASQAETFLLKWTPVASLAIFIAGYLWHRLKEAFPELLKRKGKTQE
jgi:hypothetical protein